MSGVQRRVRVLAGLAGAAALAGCATAPAPAPAPTASSESRLGQAFVARACAGCHAVGREGASRNLHAPPFRDLAARRSDAELARAIGEISRNGHVEMPPVYVTPEEMRGVVAYIRGLSGRAT